jgi:non-ribosomal peptide synthetase-like protein
MGSSRDVLTADPTDNLTTLAECERLFAEVLTDVVGTEHVSVDSHFFDDIGADSMLMARFCARVRKRADLPSVSMPDIYQHPTIRSLAAALANTETETKPTPASQPATPAALIEPPRRARNGEYVLCGALQLLIFLAYAYLAALVTIRGYEWISAGTGLVDIYLRSVLFGGAIFLGMCTLPILVKWLLIGLWKPQQIRIWSVAYVRFWFVKTLVRTNPLVLFAGSPLYVLYLRALGAKVGRGVTIFTRYIPICTDLFTVGDGTVIRKDSHLQCYRAYAGQIQTGAVTLGKDVIVGEASVLDIETAIGDGGQLGHVSALHAGQSVPAGERWHGSPGQPTETDYRAVDPARCGAVRRISYSVLQLLAVLLVYLPLAFSGLYVLFTAVPQLAALLDPSDPGFTSWTFYVDALETSSVIFFGSILVGFVLVGAVPRVLALAITPGRTYCLYGFHYWIHRTIASLTNHKFFMNLFGDSSAIVYYLRFIGYDLSQVVQTGTNFGGSVKHETPYESVVGTGTMVADDLSLINADFSSSSFRVTRTLIGTHSFFGNYIFYPAQSRTGDNVLLGTKAMVPIDGPIREGIGLLGSPSFEIPRSVERDSRFDYMKTGDELRRRLAGKNRHNTVTAALFLLVRWINLFAIVLIFSAAAELFHWFGAVVFVLANVLALLFTVGLFVLYERASRGFRRLQPLYCSIYEPAFWRHERYWKAAGAEFQHAFDGTPFKNVVWRLLGLRLGRRVFDDGAVVTERTLTTIGDDCVLNAGSSVQCHSQEDGTFKSDYITIGAGCTVGVGAWVHYGTTMGEGSVLAADTFLMKGEEVPPHARWGGNPAREIRNGVPLVPAALTPPVTPSRIRKPVRAAGALVVGPRCNGADDRR